jgi:hypothetical protein
MASLTFAVSGSAAVATELRDRLNEVGTALGYGARRGELAGRGAGGGLIRAISEGSALVVPVDQVEDLAWLAEQLAALAAEQPERKAAIENVLDGIKVAQRMDAKGKIGSKGEKVEDDGGEA